MHIDAKNCFTLQSDGTLSQAVRPASTTADSTNVLDLGAANKGKGEPLKLFVQVTETYTDDSGTNLTLACALHDSADNSSFASVLSSAAIPLASLVAGYVFPMGYLPDTVRRYVKLVFTTAGGTPPAGKICAALVHDSQTA